MRRRRSRCRMERRIVPFARLAHPASRWIRERSLLPSLARLVRSRTLVMRPPLSHSEQAPPLLLPNFISHFWC
ncbi:hypothetical protein PMAYCL1PPCAC_33412 [Pristionchus mayeri]|uniref:Uncharacterized protein n=1 Tax=Pristionchus mayeri TaxID=1317129 RepID=A0AAN5DIU2_9BILA|nr:hypothetical protein PMAYCL1PPCAC_28254 [Pristionchus mayeri]GMR63217.1 hypothetical protein PMAYCL1PPCAC_33412 [Pristionchus mayeri]